MEPGDPRDEGPAGGRPLVGPPFTRALLVVVVSAVVALAATDVGLLLPALELDDRWRGIVRIAGAVGVGAGLLGLLAQRRRLRPKGGRGPDPTAAGLLAAGTIMGLLALVANLAPTRAVENASDDGGRIATEGVRFDRGAAGSGLPLPPPGPTPPGEGAGPGGGRGGGGGGVGGARPPGAPAGTEPRSPWEALHRLSNLFLLLLLLAVGVMAVRALTKRPEPRRKASPDPGVDAGGAEEGLRASLDELARGGRDPRWQITAAYHRLLTALGSAGAPRRPEEAPHEHLYRVLGPLGVRAGPMHRLAELYVAAQFSERPMTERHRAAAVEALAVSLQQLRSARPAVAAREPSSALSGARA